MIAVAILAAGQGKRMGNPDRAKVLAPLFDKPLLGYVLDQARALAPDATVVIVGHQRQAVTDYVRSVEPDAICVVQEQQLGTGHAVLQTEPVLAEGDYAVVILSGDVPLLKSQTLFELLEHHRAADAACTVLTTSVSHPFGYGRIVRNASGALAAIVEQKDATPEQETITEINSGIYVVNARSLFPALHAVRTTNAQNEYYLTDIVGILAGQGQRIEAFHTPNWEEVHGINTVADLERAAELLLPTGV